jgi:tetratricopeptide (TPR) repeat protein
MMEPTLNLVEHLLSTGRRLQELGRIGDALRVLKRLASFRQLPEEAAEETQVRLGELHLKRRRFRLARRHLTAALRHQPDEARYHQLMAVSCLAEGRGDLKRAAEHYRRALELDPDCPAYLVGHGLLAIQLGQTDEGLASLSRAAELAPEDPEVIGKLARGLCQAGQADEARKVLRAALFRNPRQQRFRRLWEEFQFQQLRQQQQLERLNRARLAGEDEEPVLLPFVRPEGDDTDTEGGSRRTRRDGPARLPSPHLPWVPQPSEQRYVQ